MTALLPTSLGASGGSQTALVSSVFPQASGSPALAAAQYWRMVVLIFATSFFDMAFSLGKFLCHPIIQKSGLSAVRTSRSGPSLYLPLISAQIAFSPFPSTRAKLNAPAQL